MRAAPIGTCTKPGDLLTAAQPGQSYPRPIRLRPALPDVSKLPHLAFRPKRYIWSRAWTAKSGAATAAGTTAVGWILRATFLLTETTGHKRTTILCLPHPAG